MQRIIAEFGIFGERAEIVRSGGVDASVDNMLKIVRC